MVVATSMRAPTATPLPRGAPGASLRRGASARASRVGASSARRPVAARAAAFAPRRAPARVPVLAPVGPTRDAAGASRAASLRASASATPNGPNASSADAVNNGLACFEARQYEDAVANFTSALNDFGVPSEDESRAALYNRACAQCKLRRFDEAKTVFHGDGFIVLFDREIDCLDVAWVDPTYIDGSRPTEIDVNALQFHFNDASQQGGGIRVGTFSVAGDGVVTSRGLLNVETFTNPLGREGTLTIDEADEDKVRGGFTVQFSEGAVSGEFESEFCRNLG